MSEKHEKPEALRRQESANEQRNAQLDELKHDDHGTEPGAAMAPYHNESPGEQHRAGPLPNMKR